MGLIVPGRNVVCTRSVECVWCAGPRATEGSIYLCEGVLVGEVMHRMMCDTPNCDGFLLRVAGKSCAFCACCFKPLDDGDASLVQDEEENPYDAPAPTAPANPEKETEDA